ncbi:MAG: GGDEF domain-containing protein [Azospirillaceae bacterium]|nr:GGDEF domain-containing protein [Azospirillaceae bacterium]
MRYFDDRERAAEIARQAVDRMAAEALPPTPDNFTIWYNYYSDQNPELRRAIDILHSNKQLFTPDRVEEIFRRFIGPDQHEETVQQTLLRLQAALASLATLLGEKSADAGRYSVVLNSFSGVLTQRPRLDDLRDALDQILLATEAMVEQNARLQTQLNASSAHMAELEHNLVRVRRESLTDPLTGLYNRKHFDASLSAAAAAAMESGQSLSLLMVDIDHFKLFNDRFGHIIGDHVLALVAQILTDCIKGRDTATRYGGEEFAIILPDTHLQDSVKVAEQIRTTVASRRVVNRSNNQRLGLITLSVGCAEYEPGEPLRALVHRADEALYAAKRAGRNRVEQRKTR